MQKMLKSDVDAPHKSSYTSVKDYYVEDDICPRQSHRNSRWEG